MGYTRKMALQCNLFRPYSPENICDIPKTTITTKEVTFDKVEPQQNICGATNYFLVFHLTVASISVLFHIFRTPNVFVFNILGSNGFN